MIKKILVCLVIMLCSTAMSKSTLLNRIITVEIKNTPVKTILTTIENRAQVQFSYNPDLIDENKLVSLSIQKKTIAFGLALIFNKNVRFKEVGNHIVLLKNEDLTELKKRKKSKLFTTFKGIITNGRSNAPITAASIYDIDARYAAISDTNGYYELKIPKAETVRSLYIRKKGFKEFVFVIDVSLDTIVVKNIQLIPEEEIVEKIDQPDVDPIYKPIEEKVLSGGLISYDVYVHTENLKEIKEERIAQIALVPSLSIGSNLSTNGLIVNNFSLNILAGYAKGVKGAEVGGILNMIKEDVCWFQAGGVGNLVGGNLQGVQGAGVFNFVKDNIHGAQFSGVINNVGGNFTGLQGAGIFNSVYGEFRGVQLGGIMNKVNNDFNGIQAAGIGNFNKGVVTGAQLGGVISGAKGGFKGVQLSGIANITNSNSYGFQAAGIHNISRGTLYGAQIAGISSFSNAGTNIIQLSGIINGADVNKGLQMAGIFNHAKSNNGLQIGLINTSVDGKGIAIGLINFVLEGYHKTEISANETFPINLTLKSGKRRFYNTYHFSVKFGDKSAYAAGFGLGTNFNLSEKWMMSCDISSQIILENKSDNFKFTELYKLSTTVDYPIAKWATLFAGPSVNFNLNRFQNDDGSYTSNIGFSPFYNEQLTNSNLQIWMGGQIGIRF